jgi:hypothetical protein
MRLLLRQQLVGNVVYIAADRDDRYHVLWCRESLGSADTVKAAIQLAVGGPLVRPADGSIVNFLKVSADPDRWMLCASDHDTDGEDVAQRPGSAWVLPDAGIGPGRVLPVSMGSRPWATAPLSRLGRREAVVQGARTKR